MGKKSVPRLSRVLVLTLCICALVSILSPGAVMSAWPTDPSINTPVCNAPGNQYAPRLIKVTDGYIVFWQDERRVYRDIYAQKFDVNGNMKWADNGRVVASGNNGEASNHLVYNSQSLTDIVSDTQGGAIALWTEDYTCGSGPCGNAWITRIHSNGAVQWGKSPSPGVTIQGTDTAVLLNNHAHADAIAPDGEGGAFVIFGVDAWGSWYVYRMDANGAYRSSTANVVGARSGARMIYGGNSNGKDYVNIAWWDYGAFAIKIADPEVNYPGSTDTLYAPWAGITLSTTTPAWFEPSLTTDGAGGAIVVWGDNRSDPTYGDLFAQKISANGSVQWTPAGVPIVVKTSRQRYQQLVSDGAGGAVVVWEDWRDVLSGGTTRIYAQRIGADGSILWAQDGIPISSSYGESPKIIKSEDGAYIIAWVDTDHNGGTPDYLRLQKINGAGSLLWPLDSRTPEGGTTGVVIGEIYGDDFDIASDGSGGVIAVWSLGGDIYAKRVIDYLDSVQKVFIGYYQRPAAPAGLIFWANQLNEVDGNLDAIIEAFANSPESQRLYGPINSSNISSVVTTIYWALFNRAPKQAGLDFYVNGFNLGWFTPATIMLNILDGAQNEDLQSVNNKVNASNLFTWTIDPDLDGMNFLYHYSGDADAQKAREFLAAVTSDPASIPTPDQVTLFINNNLD